MSTDDSVQWVSTAWINRLRDEVLRVGRQRPEVARVVGIGVWIATYVDKDGSGAFPSRQTLATLAGCSVDTVTNAVNVLMGVGVLTRRRRPNKSAVYQLLMPLGGDLDWASHIHHMTETRQRKAHAKKKADAARKASTDAVENQPDPVDSQPESVRGRLPESVRVGGSGKRPRTSSENPESVHGRPREASTDVFRKASTDAPTKPTTTCGSDPHTDHNLAGLSPQPQQRAGEAAKDESSTGERPAAKPTDIALAAVRAREPLARCTSPDCGMPLPYGAIGLCAGCKQYLTTTNRERHTA